MKFLILLIPLFSWATCEDEFQSRRKEELLELLNSHEVHLPTMIASNKELREEYWNLIMEDRSLDWHTQTLIFKNIRLARIMSR